MILERLGAPITPENINLVVAWIWCEQPHYPGGAWRWNNPLCTTLACCNYSGVANAAGVKIYPTKEDGVEAAVRTLLGGNFPTLAHALQTSNPGEFLSATTEISRWGTNPECLRKAYSSLGPPPEWVFQGIGHPISLPISLPASALPAVALWLGLLGTVLIAVGLARRR